MANPTVVVHHGVVTGAPADPSALVDGPAWDAAHSVTVSGLDQVDNTSDVNKPVSTAQAAANATVAATAATATALKANIASPTFTGVPAAPTAAVDTNTTQIATTAMVLAQAASATPLINGTAAVGTSTRFARGDHVHPAPTVASLTDTAWTTYVPTSAFSTPGTSVMATASGRWKQIGKVVHFTVDATVTTIGTGTGNWLIGLPTATNASNLIVGASGREVATLGVLLAISGNTTTTCIVSKYDNTTLATGGNGTRINFAGSFEAA